MIQIAIYSIRACSLMHFNIAHAWEMDHGNVTLWNMADWRPVTFFLGFCGFAFENRFEGRIGFCSAFNSYTDML